MNAILDLGKPCTHEQLLTEARRVGLTKNIIAGQFNISANTIKRWYKLNCIPAWAYRAFADLIIDAQIWGPLGGASDFSNHIFIRRDAARFNPKEKETRLPIIVRRETDFKYQKGLIKS